MEPATASHKRGASDVTTRSEREAEHEQERPERGVWVHWSLLDSALRRLRRVEREIRVERHLTGMCLMGVYLIGVICTS